ncbi:tyrosine-type recombinase/integrase [Rhodopirellula sp. JC639]|uniref:tyrosine-type recombinase/integrase n=1 Tax=Stieleria mannarensis TaxID=2755585 RepID=UPI0015FF988F|nr:site-specific integrase [Rhodopirellula sp. JC639]
MLDPTELEATFDNLMRFTLDKSGELTPRRRGQGQRSRIATEIRVELEAILKRPIEVDDINADFCELLVLRWKRQGMRRTSITFRYEWFITANKVAAKLGWAKLDDFRHIKPERSRSWHETRQNVEMPEITPAPVIDESKAAEQQMTLSAMLEDHYIPARLVGKSKNTIRLYRICIRNFTKWLGRDPIVADMNTETIGKYLRHSLEHLELSPHTVEKEAAEFRSFWTFAAKRGWLPTFPEIPAISCPKRIPDAWSDDQMVKLMGACESATGTIGRNKASHFWPALVSVIYDCGERISAVLSITHTDIDAQGWLTVRGEYRKGKTRDKRYKLRPVTVERIGKLHKGDGLVFPLPYSQGYIYQLFGEILKAAGLPNTRRDKFHKIRRTTASNFEAAGGNATALLDHTDRRTTEAYLDPRFIKSIQPADIVPGIGEAGVDQDATGDGNAKLLDQFRDFLKQQEAGQ